MFKWVLVCVLLALYCITDCMTRPRLSLFLLLAFGGSFVYAVLDSVLVGGLF